MFFAGEPQAANIRTHMASSTARSASLRKDLAPAPMCRRPGQRRFAADMQPSTVSPGAPTYVHAQKGLTARRFPHPWHIQIVGHENLEGPEELLLARKCANQLRTSLTPDRRFMLQQS